MAAIRNGGYLVLNEVEASWLTTPYPTRHLQGGVCVTFEIGVEPDALVSRLQIRAVRNDESQLSESRNQRFKGLIPFNVRRTLTLLRVLPLTHSIIGTVGNA